MRRQAVAAVFLLAALLTGCTRQAEEAPVWERPAAEAPAEEAALPEMAEGLPDWAGAYFRQVLVYGSERPEAEYALIDLTGGEVPALAAGYGGSVSLYQYGDGALHTLMDHWIFDVMGRYEYEYLPGQKVIRELRRYEADEEGAALYTNYFFVAEDYTLDSYTISLWYPDAVARDYDSGDERFGKATHFYLGEEEITKAAYEDYEVGGAFFCICGDTPCLEFLEQLNALAGPDGAAA